MLTGLLRLSRSLREKVSVLEADVNRLKEGGPNPLRNPDIAVKISVCESELKELEARMESTIDELVDAWRRKRQELKQLRSGVAGGLSPDVYESLFTDSHRWCAPIDHAQKLGEELSQRLEDIKAKRPEFALPGRGQ